MEEVERTQPLLEVAQFRRPLLCKQVVSLCEVEEERGQTGESLVAEQPRRPSPREAIRSFGESQRAVPSPAADRYTCTDLHH